MTSEFHVDKFQGDWGAFITRVIGLRYPESCKASHINMVYAKEPTWTAGNPKPNYTDREKVHLSRKEAWESGDERGYFAIQCTRVSVTSFRCNTQGGLSCLPILYKRKKITGSIY